jgi:S-adenosylmethionine:tRNA ribosyltransferase-isomerase
VEIFLLQQRTSTIWECLLGKIHPKPGLTLNLRDDFTAVVLGPAAESTWIVEFNKPNITSIGTMPLPPYITEQAVNPAEYQTVYAQPEGSVAAPTAGLHFTNSLLDNLKQRGVIIAPITLHVGLGTFAPVRTDDLSQHVMHAEFGSLPLHTAQHIQRAKQSGHRVMAVGTTALRTLEALADDALAGGANDNWIDLFITPGYTFRVADGLITNFHLPKTTLLMLVAAFMGKPFMDQAYQAAMDERYRFYSFGDAMLIQ